MFGTVLTFVCSNMQSYAAVVSYASPFQDRVAENIYTNWLLRALSFVNCYENRTWNVRWILHCCILDQGGYAFHSCLVQQGYFWTVGVVFVLSGIAVRESAAVGDQAQRRLMRGVDDLDFYIGDEAIDKPNYATKVEYFQPWTCVPISHGTKWLMMCRSRVSSFFTIKYVLLRFLVVWWNTNVEMTQVFYIIYL